MGTSARPKNPLLSHTAPLLWQQPTIWEISAWQSLWKVNLGNFWRLMILKAYLLLVTMASLAVAIRLCSYSHTPSCNELWKNLIYESPEQVKACTITVQDGHIHKNWPRVIYRFTEFTRVLLLSSELFEWVVATTTQEQYGIIQKRH